jgi:hypothetical protein
MAKEKVTTWIVASFLLYPGILKEKAFFPIFEKALSQGYSFPIFREQVC